MKCFHYHLYCITIAFDGVHILLQYLFLLLTLSVHYQFKGQGVEMSAFNAKGEGSCRGNNSNFIIPVFQAIDLLVARYL